MFVKLSILCQYLRLCKPGVTRVFAQCMIVVTTLWGTAWAFISWFPCVPIGSSNCYGWAASQAIAVYRTCIAQVISNMCLDVVIFLTTIPIYLQQGSGSRARTGLIGLLALGSL